MVDYAFNAAMGSLAPLVSKDKGSFDNRIDCAGKQFANNVSNAAESTAVVAGSAVGYHILNKATKGKTYKWNANLNKELKKATEKISIALKDIKSKMPVVKAQKVSIALKDIKSRMPVAEIKAQKGAFGKLKLGFVKNLIKASEFMKKNIEKLAKTSGRQKLLGALVLGSLGLLMHVGQKHAYKAGQIDQKYTDKAQSQKTL